MGNTTILQMTKLRIWEAERICPGMHTENREKRDSYPALSAQKFTLIQLSKKRREEEKCVIRGLLQSQGTQRECSFVWSGSAASQLH
jgi:hypothetical protein